MKFSVVVPLMPGREAEVLDSFKKVDYAKKDYEVIVEESYFSAKNKNKGAKRSKYDMIYFSDDDAYVDPQIFKKAEIFFKDHPNYEIMGGPQLTPKEDGFFARMSGYVFANWFGTANMKDRYSKGKLNLDANENHLTSANLFVHRDVMARIGGFKSDLWPGEDPEFLKRAKDNGVKIAYAPGIFIYHKRREDFMGFLKQFFNYGFVRKTKDDLNKSVDPLFYLPGLFVAYVLLFPLWINITSLALLPVLVYLILVGINSVYIGVRYSFLMLPFLPLIFFFTHFSYGLGRIMSLFSSGK